MSIHAIYPCPGCKQSFSFPEQHWPHCPGNPHNLSGAVKRDIEAIFTKRELALISRGPLPDKPVSKRSKKGARR